MSKPVEIRKSLRTVRPRPRSDMNFTWAAAIPACRAWRNLLVKWAGTRSGPASAKDAALVLLDYARAHETEGARPIDHCCQGSALAQRLSAWVQHKRIHASTARSVHQFFEWLMEQEGPRARSEGLVNPIIRPPSARTASETSRRVLPLYYIQMLLELLTENDWAWAKTVPTDWAYLPDPATGQKQPTWSPVRASALALLLIFPLRSFQVRMLDSGEGDDEVWDDGRWRVNTGAHAPETPAGRRHGFIRRFFRRDGDHFAAFFINTNKTAHRVSGIQDPGYDLPWQHPEALRIASELRRWQERFNPVNGPVRWQEIVGAVSPINGLNRQGDVYFLFRDPLSDRKNLPLSYGSIVALWVKLMAALEVRLAERGMRRADGSPIELVRKEKFGALYGLHSLRVSLLSHLARDGKVPLHILSKHVAGHASLVMTLHYLKSDPSEISEALNEASVLMASKEQEAFARHLAQERFDDTAFVSNDAAGGAALRSSDPGMWIQMATGLCPVAGTRCGDGGPRMGKDRYAPVPGGDRNCTACRFHITGPAFLAGLVARFNATSGSHDFAREELARAKACLTTAENRLFDAEQSGTPHKRSEVARARVRHLAAVRRVEETLTMLHQEYDLIERTKQTAKQGGLNLVLAGPLAHVNTAVRGTSQCELWDAMCQAAHVYPAPELDRAVERRGKMLDRLLLDSGHAPVFLDLDHDASLAAGNEMMRLRRLQLGADRAFHTIDGRLTDADALTGDGVRHRLAALTGPTVEPKP